MTPASHPAIRVADAPSRYGLVSRLFHWVMAYLLLWQCLMFVGWRILDEGVMRSVTAFGPSHSTTGVLVLALVVPRALWAFFHRARTNGEPPLGRPARVGHALLYILMLIIPALAVLRAYGSGKGLMLGEMQLVPATSHKIAALSTPADLLHAVLGWSLAVLVIGHIAIALLHHFVNRDGSLGRMVGK